MRTSGIIARTTGRRTGPLAIAQPRIRTGKARKLIRARDRRVPPKELAHPRRTQLPGLSGTHRTIFNGPLIEGLQARLIPGPAVWPWIAVAGPKWRQIAKRKQTSTVEGIEDTLRLRPRLVRQILPPRSRIALLHPQAARKARVAAECFPVMVGLDDRSGRQVAVGAPAWARGDLVDGDGRFMAVPSTWGSFEVQYVCGYEEL